MVKPRAIPWYCETLDMSVEDSHVDYLSWIKQMKYTVIISWNIQPKIWTNQTTRKAEQKGCTSSSKPFPPQCQVSQVSNLIKMTSTGQRQRPLLESRLQKSWMSCPILTQSEKNISWKKKTGFKVYSSMVLISYLWEVDFCGLSFLWGGFISYRQSAMNLYRSLMDKLSRCLWNDDHKCQSSLSSAAQDSHNICPQKLSGSYTNPPPTENGSFCRGGFESQVISCRWFSLEYSSCLLKNIRTMSFHEFSGTPRPTFCSFSMRCQLILTKTISWSYCWWQWSCDEWVSRNP